MAWFRSAAQPALAGSIPSVSAPSRPSPTQSRFRGMMQRLRRNKQARRLIVAGFRGLQHAGISVVPRHFYWPVPDLNQLSLREWPVQSELAALDLRLDQQMAFLEMIVPQFAPEYLQFPARPVEPQYLYHYNNGLFESVDAEVAYTMVRHLRPRQIIEIGSGFSTRVMAAALRHNHQLHGDRGGILCVEPYADAVLRQGIPGVSTLVETPVQKLSSNFVDDLQSGDILFIDSSHVVAVGSDVAYEVLELLPRLRKGVVVHFHDIFLPADYPRGLVREHLSFWSEQYMVQAFLAFNRTFEVLWSSSAMHLAHPAALDKAFPAWTRSYADMPEHIRQFMPTHDRQRIWPSSLWIRRVN